MVIFGPLEIKRFNPERRDFVEFSAVTVIYWVPLVTPDRHLDYCSKTTNMM